ncbi:DNA translocase FtsK [Patescibacteria group bacterium]|nr:DNA translocase FtsK [Patescibacteria group bacterium]
MARKRKRRARGSVKRDLSIPDGIKNSILAILFITCGVIILLSFFEMAGIAGIYINNLLASVFGWDRWLFAIVLFLVGWKVVFPDAKMMHPLSVAGIILFFLSFNGLLNLLLAPTETTQVEDILNAGGYIGLLVSAALANGLGFWGAFVISVAIILASLILAFNVSLQSIFSAKKHFSSIGSATRRVGNKTYINSAPGEVDDSEDDSDEVEEKASAKPVYMDSDTQDSAQESVMTSTRRRKTEIPLDLLDEKSSEAKSGDIDRSKEIIQNTFLNFGIDVEMVDVRVGPAVTQYSLRPALGIKLSRIVALQNDLALALAAHPIRIEAPIPGKSLVGIEVPNQTVGMVGLKELLNSKEFKKRKTDFTSPLGKDVSGVVQMLAVDKAPHALVAGATGSGKSVCLNIIILSLLYQNGPDDLKLIMVDPKRVELGVYTGIPHLLVPPITKVDEAINALKWAVREMERRLDHLSKFGARDIDAYNEKSKERMPKIVIVIDELADLMSQNKRDVEAVIVRIAQMARAAGIHLVLATQRPSVDVITGTIKANIPTRLAFAVASQVDSKTILDISGAEKLLGRGDMLISTPEMSKPRRLQGAYVTDNEIEKVVNFLKEDSEPDYNYQITEDGKTGGSSFSGDDSDPLMDDAIQVVLESGKASTSYLQRRLKVGYSRAARIIDIMEEMGVIGSQNGSKPRDILLDRWPLNSDSTSDDDQDNDSNIDNYEEHGGEEESFNE